MLNSTATICDYVDAGGVAVNGQLMWSLMACRGQSQTVGDGPLLDPGCGAPSSSDPTTRPR